MHSNFNSRTGCNTQDPAINTRAQNVVSQPRQSLNSKFSRPGEPSTFTCTTNLSAQRRKFDAISELYFWAINELDGHIYEYRRPAAFVTTLLPLTPIEVEYSVLGVSTTLDAKRFADEFILRRELAARGLVQTSGENKNEDTNISSVERCQNFHIYVALAVALIVGLCIQHFGWDHLLYWMSSLILFSLYRLFTVDDLRGRAWLSLELLNISQWPHVARITTARFGARLTKFASKYLSGICKDESHLQAMISISGVSLFILAGNPVSIRFALAALSLCATITLGRLIIKKNVELREQLRSLKARIGQLETDKISMHVHARKPRDNYDNDFVDSANEMED